MSIPESRTGTEGETSLAHITAAQAAAAIRSGRITSRELVEACLDRISEREDTVQAWAHLDREHALNQADEADRTYREGRAYGALHGVPVGIKDIFDTEDMPTEDGTVLHSGRKPFHDSTVVSLLRQAGAVIMGKTVTTELAVYAPGKTRNPHDPSRTPGGSSSGSAAAVADFMVPLALGSQTNGSVIRPAGYCGVCGFKPTHGLISRQGVLHLSRLLDQIGVFARTIEDAALITERLIGFDFRDPDTEPQARPPLVDIAAEEPPVPPRFAFAKTPVWDEADDDTKEAFQELVEHLGDQVKEIKLADIFDEAVPDHRTIMEADLAKNLATEYERGKDKLSSALREMIERGQKHLAVDYNRAAERRVDYNAVLMDVFERYDVILTPATTGEAPAGLESTGSPIFCSIWTLCGVPAITVPLLQGSNGMPMGVQLVAARGDDGRLLRTARWLAEFVSQ